MTSALRGCVEGACWLLNVSAPSGAKLAWGSHPFGRLKARPSDLCLSIAKWKVDQKIQKSTKNKKRELICNCSISKRLTRLTLGLRLCMRNGATMRYHLQTWICSIARWPLSVMDFACPRYWWGPARLSSFYLWSCQTTAATIRWRGSIAVVVMNEF